MSKTGFLPPGNHQLVLASASPRRLELLTTIGLVPDRISAPDIDEKAGLRELPRDYALRMAVEKAEKIHASAPDSYILAADTVVACGRSILPKAETRAEVGQCLTRLGGRAHRVHGGICLIAPDGTRQTRQAESRVKMRRLSAGEMTAYLASDEGLGKAGGYAIQGRAAGFISQITGSWSNIVGLDLYLTANLLIAAGFRHG